MASSAYAGTLCNHHRLELISNATSVHKTTRETTTKQHTSDNFNSLGRTYESTRHRTLPTRQYFTSPNPSHSMKLSNLTSPRDARIPTPHETHNAITQQNSARTSRPNQCGESFRTHESQAATNHAANRVFLSDVMLREFLVHQHGLFSMCRTLCIHHRGKLISDATSTN